MIFKALRKLINQEKPVDSDRQLLFASTTALERALDGSEEAFQLYYFAMYHCLPEEKNELNTLRTEIQKKYPEKSVMIGRRFVLFGEAAFQIVSSYYHALALQGDPDTFREYSIRRTNEITQKHRASQSLPVPIDLSEGQLSNDPNLDFYACLALSNRQIFVK
ncbi:hypothetical protein [Niveispirillum lacus]|uniref:hypothetical protein n=1 Tax=Niveispirillum lacus TaxID=1981099 RepID=UPI001055AA83|nr:hypothetical protein [Niveispirillum lacus]